MRRVAITLAVVTCLLVAGCGAGSPDPTGTPTATSTATPTETTGATPTAGFDIERPTVTATTAGTAVGLERRSPPDPPSDLTNASAKRVALAAEKAHLVNELRNETAVTSFEFGYTQPSTARVRSHTEDGISVAVQVRYSYATEEKSVDGAPSRALYLVNETAVRRVRSLD